MTYEEIIQSRKTLIMGVINVTPDSFSDGGQFMDVESILERVQEMESQGVDIIDIGAESSRPGASSLAQGEELERLRTVIPLVRHATQKLLSIDTKTPEVAEYALKEGFDIVNDISGLEDPAMRSVCAQSDAIVVIMHMNGSPETMQDDVRYGDVVKEVSKYLNAQVSEAVTAGISKIILDPGIGFGKSIEHNLKLIKSLQVLSVEYPVLVGLSRKAFIGHITQESDPKDRMIGSVAGACAAAIAGAKIIRCHDVAQTRKALDVIDAIEGA